MNALKNKVQLIGNLGNDPEIKTLDNGKKLAKFSIAVNESYLNNKGEKVTETQWVRIIAWAAQAKIVEKFLLKGTEVMIDGKLVSSNYVDKEGVKKYVTEIMAQDLLVINKKQ
jgi:single-strand DNA-binding protein